jgi:hypothetical protein
MSEAAKMRMERITRLLNELEYEIVRGVMEREIEPELHFSKIFPCSNRGNGTAVLELHLSPGSNHWGAHHDRMQGPKLRVVRPGD